MPRYIDAELIDSPEMERNLINCDYHELKKDLELFPTADVIEVPETGMGDLSDGYHTFNGLYDQRRILFAALVKAYKDKAWKSYKHEDGELCFGGGWFIVGIDTPKGSYTYHYENKYWDNFDCVELPVAKHWDGHTEEDAENRLMSLHIEEVKHGHWIAVKHKEDEFVEHIYRVCPCCMTEFHASLMAGCCADIKGDGYVFPRCPQCGAIMDGKENE